MTRPWLIAPPEGEDVRRDVARAIPVLETERLILRAPRLSDWPALEPCWTGPRAAHIGGPLSEEDAYLDFCQAAASWLLRGHGPFTVTERASAIVLGSVGIFHDYGDPEAELGWILTEAAEGRGFAAEAARAVRDWGFQELGLTTLVSFIDPGNARSIRLAKTLGACLVPDADVTHADGDVTRVFRHKAPDAAPSRLRQDAANENGTYP